MKYSVDKTGSDPAYMQLYRQLREDILSGALSAGTRLPSKRLLAGELSVSVITVEHAYALLVDEGYVRSRQRSGFFVSFGAAGGARPGTELPAPAAPAGELSAAAEDFPFSALAKTMRRVLSDYDRRILVRSPGCGCIELRRAIAGYLDRSRGIRVPPEQIIVGSGAEYLYSLVVQLLGRGCVFALEEPCYDKIRRVYEANGASCRSLVLGEDGILSSELERCECGALHVTPYHSFPSGVTASAPKRHEYARWARERGSYIIEDDYDSEFSSLNRQIDTIFSIAPENVLYLNTFSKTLAPSMRMGYMVLPEHLAEEYARRLDFYSCTVPVFEQYVLAEFIDRGELERYINRRRRKLRQKGEIA